ncbi:MAG: hypothetical protein ACYTCN_07495, partial [Planctomycetota bacterium]
IRGGSYHFYDVDLSSSYRYFEPPNLWYYDIGFRVASVPVACPSADVTNDCFVDLKDLAKLASEWLTGIQE